MGAKDFFKGAALGALFASVATIFMAPQAGSKTRDEATKLVNNLMKKIEKETKNLSNMSQQKYAGVVTKTLKEYAKDKKMTKEYMAEAETMLLERWDEVQKMLPTQEEVKKVAKKVLKKTAKKAKK